MCTKNTPEVPPDELIDLKAILMRLGNRLVTEHGFEPALNNRLRQAIAGILRWAKIPADSIDGIATAIHGCVLMHYEGGTIPNTEMIKSFTEFLNFHSDARNILAEMGFSWPMVQR